MDDKIREKLKYRKSLFVDTVTRKPHDRIPLFANVWTWKIFDAGYTLNDCLYDYDKMADATYKFQEKYDFDADFAIGNRNPIKMLDTFGVEIYTIDNEKGHLNFKDLDTMDAPEDFKVMVEKKFYRYIYENILPRKYNVQSKESAIELVSKAFKEFNTFISVFGKVQNTLIDKYGLPAFCKGRYDVPAEIMFSGGLRGIRSFSTDMRRYPEQLENMLTDMAELTTQPFFDSLDSYVDDERMIFPCRLTCLAHTIMNEKQFNRFYWPYLKQYGDELAKRDMNAYIFVEGSIAHIVDFYRELPENRLMMGIEQDDPLFLKERLPNLTIAGGYPATLLGTGTVKECEDEAKRLIDTLAYDGNWIYTQNKMISYKNDAKAENLIAVNNIMKTYGIYS